MYFINFIMHIFNYNIYIFLLILDLLDIWHHPLFTFVQVHWFLSMWGYGHHFCTKDANDGHVTLDYGVEFMLNQFTHASHND